MHVGVSTTSRGYATNKSYCTILRKANITDRSPVTRQSPQEPHAGAASRHRTSSSRVTHLAPFARRPLRNATPPPRPLADCFSLFLASPCLRRTHPIASRTRSPTITALLSTTTTARTPEGAALCTPVPCISAGACRRECDLHRAISCARQSDDGWVVRCARGDGGGTGGC